MRKAEVRRDTRETRIAVKLNLDGTGRSAIDTGVPFLDHMLERGSGRIVNISSVIGQSGNIGQANYAASKSGQFGFTKSLALELARKGITVNCVAPGFIETEMVAGMPEAVRDAVIARIPVGRLGRVSEVARCVRFLVDDDAGYITGAILAVNGGLEM